jgi:hypothetical protein
VRNLAQRGAHELLAVAHQHLEPLAPDGDAFGVQQLLQASDAHLVRADLRHQVAAPFVGRAHIVQNQFQQRLVQRARLQNLDGWDAQSLLVDFGRQRHRARRCAAGVGVVRAARHEAH